MLREHAELAMKLCKQIVKQAEDANWLGIAGDQAFARVSHAMHVSIALKQRIDAEAAQEHRRAAREAAEVANERKAEAAQEAAERKNAALTRKFDVSGGVKAVINNLPPSVVGTVNTGQLTRKLELRMLDLDVTRELEGRTVAEVVAQICRELGVPEVAITGVMPAPTAEDHAAQRAAQMDQIAACGARIYDAVARGVAPRVFPRSPSGRAPPDG